ncbi:MAG: glycosyltransferase, partial [Thermoanaerobaculia bacterium]|nr:glycosyltransferase [Thermoanaerobaculia bacterium]
MQILVLGMHRSGTSAVGAVLERLGLYFGPPEAALAPQPDNPRGFWERRDVVALNDELLAAAGGSWSEVSALDRRTFESALPREIEERFEGTLEDLEAHRPWFVKDPRLCLTLPAWRERLDAPLVVFVYRPPGEIAASLAERNDFPLPFSVALWEYHLTAAANASAGLPRITVAYPDLVESPVETVAELRGRLLELGVELPDEPPEEAILKIVDPKMRHHRGVDSVQIGERRERLRERFASGVTDSAEAPLDISDDSWRELTRFDQRRRETSHQQALDALEREHRAERDQLREQIEQREHRIRELEAEFDRLREHAERSASELEAVRSELAAAEEQLGGLRTELAAVEDELEAASSEAKRLADEITKLRAAAERRREELAFYRSLADEREALQSTLTEERRRIDELGASLETSQRLAELLRQRLAGIDNAARAVLRSTRWRLGDRLGSLARRLTGRGKRVHAGVHLARALEAADGLAALETSAASADDVGDTLQPVGKAEFTSARAEELGAFLAGEERLRLDAASEPKVSVVLVLYNRADMTLGCLRTVAAEVDVPYEVVVVDNASSDETPALLDRIDGVKVLSNAENRGFVEAANQAARGANGEYLLLLNNDAELERGSVHAALEVFDREPEVGAVGGMILRLDGRLQEAGSIVWSDGSCLGYGRGDAPGHPAYMFRRDVDFCSGAFLLTPQQIFQDLGGFDERFSPAYYEETDYCLRLRERGLRTVYEPRARIRHYEFASFDSAERAVALQARNHAKFAAKHRERLSGQLPPDPANLHRARTPGNAPRVLYIDDRVPHTSLGSGFPRANRVVDA